LTLSSREVVTTYKCTVCNYEVTTSEYDPKYALKHLLRFHFDLVQALAEGLMEEKEVQT